MTAAAMRPHALSVRMIVQASGVGIGRPFLGPFRASRNGVLCGRRTRGARVTRPGQDRSVSTSRSELPTDRGTMCAMATSVGPVVRERILGSRERFWRPEDFNGSAAAVAQALSRLTRTGELRRVRRGLYWRGTPTQLGMAPPPSRRLANEIVVGPGTGPAGWSAALALGLTTQVPRRETIAVPGRAPRSPRAVRFVSRAASTKRRDERLHPAEVALLEVLRDWDMLVELSTGEAIERIARVVESGAVRVDRLVRASATEPPRVRVRLRRLLVSLGLSAVADAVRPARSDLDSP